MKPKLYLDNEELPWEVWCIKSSFFHLTAELSPVIESVEHQKPAVLTAASISEGRSEDGK